MKKEIKFVPCPMREGEDSSLELLFHLVGELGTVEFQLSTNWYTKRVRDLRLQDMKKDFYSFKEDYLLDRFWNGPQPLDVCYYSSVRMSEDDTLFNANPLKFYGYRYQDEGDGFWTTDYLYEKFLRGGEDAVWEFLENYYVEVFGELL